MQQSMRKLCFKTDCFIKSFDIIIINHFLYRKLILSSTFASGCWDDARNIKRGSKKRKIARNGKLQYSFQK